MERGRLCHVVGRPHRVAFQSWSADFGLPFTLYLHFSPCSTHMAIISAAVPSPELWSSSLDTQRPIAPSVGAKVTKGTS